MGKEMEERLNALIELISSAHRNNQLQNVAMSQIIELFNYKSEIFSCSESCMQRRLEIASEEVSLFLLGYEYRISSCYNLLFF